MILSVLSNDIINALNFHESVKKALFSELFNLSSENDYSNWQTNKHVHI